jgi:hypothetical protein
VQPEDHRLRRRAGVGGGSEDELICHAAEPCHFARMDAVKDPFELLLCDLSGFRGVARDRGLFHLCWERAATSAWGTGDRGRNVPCPNIAAA